MEKKEAIREYCIEKALVIESAKTINRDPSVDNVIKTAEKLEKYIAK